ncbi:duf410 domain containing protein [Grosmannia clavigera kw1407]|uniref:Duf410 domain containing protein n=1 Tax=Grosmannia clavigera (strain kw1407 / UAMH 11150) TaxID=655863 RepID=F0XRT9_GROCL|nr:duf410 domain containing protein [Grosmannia clavigera kw1407]EFW99623.1 duf410 domain containing protein [Grosmannia clavigera kw1407]
MASRTDKIEKIISRMQKRISEGQFYEAQQQTRVVAVRHIKTANWAAAIDILYSVAQSLLKAGQGGSGGDLSIFLVDVYKQAELKPDAANKGRLLTCLRLFDQEEPTRRKYIAEIIGWSARFGAYPAGDPELHHVIGSLYAEEHEAYEAERHLVTGTKESPEVLAHMEYDWYKQDDAHTAPLYAGRAILPYLLMANVRAANHCYRTFTSALTVDNPALAVQDVSSASNDARVFPSLPLLNFLGLLLLAIQRGSPELFRQLASRYSNQLREVESWSEPLELVAEMYFGIQQPRQRNPLFDMVGNLFGGGGSGGNRPSNRTLPSLDAPAAEGLD